MALAGAAWWAQAFEAAGYIDAYKVEILPEGVDPDELPHLPGMARRKRRPPEGEVEVFGVDEQEDEPVELSRWVELAKAVLLDSGIRGEAELSRMAGMEMRVGRIRATESLNLKLRDVISVSKDAGIEGATAMSERSTAEAAPSVDEDGDLATA